MKTLPQPSGKEKARLCRLASQTSSTSTRSSLASAHNRVLFSTILALAMAQSSVAQAVQVARREHDDAWDSPLKRAVTASTTAPVASRTSHNNANNASGKVNVTRIVVIAIAVTVLVIAVLGLLVILFLCSKRMRRTKKDQAAIAAITDPNIRRFSSRPLSSSQRREGDWWQPAPDADPDSEFNPRNSKMGRHSYHSSANRMSNMSQSHSSRHSSVYNNVPGAAAQRPYSQGGQGYTYGQTLDNPSSALAFNAGVPGTPPNMSANMSRPPSFHSSVGSSAGGSSIRQSQYGTPQTTTSSLSNTSSTQKEKPFRIPDVGGSSIGHDSAANSDTAHAIGYRFGAAMGTIPEDQNSSSLNHTFTSTIAANPNPNFAPPSSYHQMNHQPATLQYLQPQMTGTSVYSTTDPYEMSAMTKSSSGHPGT